MKYRAALWSFLKLTALVFHHVWHSPWILKLVPSSEYRMQSFGFFLKWSYSNFLDICVTNICWKFQLPTYLLRNPKICQDQPRSKIFRVDSNVLFARNFLSNICMNETFCHVNFVTLLQSVFLQTTGPRETFLACYTRKWAPLSGCLNSLAGS